MPRLTHFFFGLILALSACDRPSPSSGQEHVQLTEMVSRQVTLPQVQTEFDGLALLSDLDKRELSLRRFGRDEVLLRKVAQYPRTAMIAVNDEKTAFLFFDDRNVLKDFVVRTPEDLGGRTNL